MSLPNLHNHPLPDQPVVIVHAKYAGRAIDRENPAHCFGPFDNADAAEAWNAGQPEDECFAFLLDFIGIPPVGDLDLERVHAALIAAGLVPAFGSRVMAEQIVQADRDVRGRR